jgi:hypothetical protein
MSRVVIIAVILFGFWSGIAEGQIYSVFNMPDYFVTQIVNKSILKEAYRTYNNCLMKNKIRKAILTNDGGWSEIFEYNKSGLVTKWEIISGSGSSSHYTLLYNEDGNLFAAIYPWERYTGPDTVCTYSIYSEGRIIFQHSHSHSNKNINYYKFIYDSLITDKLTDIQILPPGEQVFVDNFKMEYDSTGSLTGFLFPNGNKYISIVKDSQSVEVLKSNKFYYKYILDGNIIKEFTSEFSTLKYFYNKNGLIEYTIDHKTNMNLIKTFYKYEYYD